MASNVMDSVMTSTTEKSANRTGKRLLRWVPSALLIAAAVLLIASIQIPYWGLVLQAPQYPGGLEMRVFVNNMTGDEDPVLDEVKEIDGLNHYIGMRSLYEAARLERAIAIPAVIIMAVLLVVLAFWRRRWSWLLAVPVLLFPVIFLADLYYWLRTFGQNLDPYAPLSSAIAPFTPPVWGEGVIGQFRTVAQVEIGWYMIVAAALLTLVALAVGYLTDRAGVSSQQG